jgi:hypothetical protein
VGGGYYPIAGWRPALVRLFAELTETTLPYVRTRPRLEGSVCTLSRHEFEAAFLPSPPPARTQKSSSFSLLFFSFSFSFSHFRIVCLPHPWHAVGRVSRSSAGAAVARPKPKNPVRSTEDGSPSRRVRSNSLTTFPPRSGRALKRRQRPQRLLLQQGRDQQNYRTSPA